MINKNFQVTFAIREDIYFQFKDLCLKEKRKPATVIREFVVDYVKKKNSKVECCEK
jgi:hypothetical protein